jgi:hypothetical protein
MAARVPSPKVKDKFKDIRELIPIGGLSPIQPRGNVNPRGIAPA